MDEPTSGLDPLMQEVFFEHVQQAKQRGAAVFLSSHNLSEVQRMCDRVGIIRGGILIAEKTVDELITAGPQRFTISFAGKVPSALDKHATVIERKPHLAVIEVADNLPNLLAFLSTQPVKHLTSAQADLEDEFLQFYGEEAA